ncbi:MAG TPA: FAD-dependent oxidoreductase [Actinoplanes sp.]
MERRTVWDASLGDSERAALRAGLPDRLDHAPDVLVIGGGIVGLAVATACRQAGLGRVVVLEKEDRLASGASGGNAGAIAPDMHLLTDGPEFVAFGRASREIYRRWDAEWDGALGLWPTRWLNLFPAGADPLVTRQAPGVVTRPAAPREFTRLDAAAVRELEPDVRMPEGGTALLVEGQVGVHPLRVVAGLATRGGAQVATGVRLESVTVRGDRIARVRTTAGDFTAGAVVFATGLVPPPWDEGVAQRWVKGHMVAVAPGPWRLGSVLAGPLGGGTPLADGTVVCGGTFDEGDVSPEVRPEVSDRLAKELTNVVPAAQGAAVAARWCCLRPYVVGRQPVVDRLPGMADGWFAGGHFTTGVMMAAGTGVAVAEWITTGHAPRAVETFALQGLSRDPPDGP